MGYSAAIDLKVSKMNSAVDLTIIETVFDGFNSTILLGFYTKKQISLDLRGLLEQK